MVNVFGAASSHLVQWDGTDRSGVAVTGGICSCQMWFGGLIDVEELAVIQ